VNNVSAPRELFRRFYFDCLTHDPQAARHLINIAGPNRVAIGTDNPFDMQPNDPMRGVDAIPDLTASEREFVCELTARELLNED